MAVCCGWLIWCLYGLYLDGPKKGTNAGAAMKPWREAHEIVFIIQIVFIITKSFYNQYDPQNPANLRVMELEGMRPK